jgi:hypothetical protein
MNIRFFPPLAAALLLVVNLFAGPRDAQWRKVDAAVEQRLPQSAIEALDPLIADALADGSHAEATRAILRKIALQQEIEGSKAEEGIVRLEAELAKAPPAMQPVMETVLAHWYWNYFQQNRWRFLNRTATAGTSDADIQTWDLPRILTEIDRHFTSALASAEMLQRMPISALDDLLSRGTVPDAYRPTVYDFLAHEALKFYQAGEQGAVSAEDPFMVDAADPLFGSAEEFLAWKIPATAAGSPLGKAVALYQTLLRFHAGDADRSAFLDVDLARLIFGNNSATGETKDERYRAALERFIAGAAQSELSSRALAMLGRQLVREEPAQARALAQRGLAAFPQSVGAADCFNLIQEIEMPSADVTTEFVWNAPWPDINVTYRNVTKIYFRAVRVDFAQHLAEARWNVGHFDRNLADRLLAPKPDLEWQANLPPTVDYRSRTEKLPAPTTLKPGFYAVIASHNPDFSEPENQLSITPVWVSDLALILQQPTADGTVGGFVLKAGAGTPIEHAVLRTWYWNGSDQEFRAGKPATTDANGRFTIAPPGINYNARFILLAESGGHALSPPQASYHYRTEKPDGRAKSTLFFTDRALYRPGQAIHYKGVSYSVDQGRGSYRALEREIVEVVFNDPNGKEIARATHVTNDYGAFSGTFTAPRDRLMGHMSLRVTRGPQGAAAFSVEEYKRPKFEVEVRAPADPARLDASVIVTGKASAYTGAAIGDAKVSWRVTRAVRLPVWCWWWQPPSTQAIAHGTAITEPDGTFKIEFMAAPDRAVPAKLEPVFHYEISADVTDTTGETRSAHRTLAAGYTALQATVSAGEWQVPDRPVEVTITTQSLDGDPQAARGTVVVHALRQPAAVERAPLQRESIWWRRETPPADPTNPDSWENDMEIARQAFTSAADGTAKNVFKLPAGIYRVSVETEDRFGKNVTARETVEVVDPSARRYGVRVANRVAAAKWTVEPGQSFTAWWGTGYDSGRAFVELECAGKTLASYWTDAGRTQQAIRLPITEAMRGGVSLRVTYVRENRAYLTTRTIDVPWSNQELSLKWERFRSKLLPGEKETWTATITGHDATKRAAEMVATLYDASLDQFRPHQWPAQFDGFRQEPYVMNAEFANTFRRLQIFRHGWERDYRSAIWNYRSFPPAFLTSEDGQVVLSAFAVNAAPESGYVAQQAIAGAREKNELRDMALPALGAKARGLAATANVAAATREPEEPTPAAPKPALDHVTARKNLNETAFFFPHLLAGEDGTVKLEFTMPEALTRWKFLGFAHDRDLRAGLLTGETVTAKDLMVQPNPPRFVREGDAIEFTVKVSNQSEQPQSGAVRLTFADAATLDNVDAALGNRAPEQSFDVPAKQSRTYSWRIAVPDGMGFLTYKAVGATNALSDGEEGFLPVLGRRILVTESLPLPIRGPVTKEFDFPKLLNSGESSTLRHQSLTVQMVSQPAWYAVMSLPYLMEYPYECSEQLFNRLYANALARHVANSDPKIRRVFDLWKNTPALDSPLQKNEDLKSVLLEETPWLRDATQESERRRNVGLLFDGNRLDEETARILQQLGERQGSDGLWSWFPGGRSNEYISLYLMTGFGRLRHLGVKLDAAPALRVLEAMDAWMDRRYREIQRLPHPEDYVPNSIDALFLYGRSFFLEDRPLRPADHPALDFFLRRARAAWTKVGSRQSEAHLALALQRFGDTTTPAAIAKSLKERSVTSEELGRFWRDSELSWWWHQAPIETQAMMIEVFAEVAHDDQAVADCQTWLLKQKQTQDWKTTKATADAVYALLLRGSNLLASDALVEVSLGGMPLKPEKVEAGTGFYEQKFVRDQIKPAMGRVTVRKTDDGVSWGSVTWQYLEDMTKVTAHEGTPLKLKKALFVKQNTAQGPVLKPVSGPVAVGDELVVRLELRTDRDMEYVHLKDQRGSGTEPVNVLSGYRYQDGLAYYESTRDTASHFFIDYLPKGTYVFEYSTRVQLKGRYQSGLAEIQCMYAPEFNSHSESATIDVE